MCLGKICLFEGGAVFVNSAQSLDGSRENACWYGERVSGGLLGGINTYGYVGGNPLSRIDPLGLKGVMPGGRWWDPPVVDNGSSCKTTALPLPQVDDDGCISTGAGPKICIGPGAIKGVATNLAEQLALEAAQSGAGQRIMQGLVNDARYPESVWAKMQYVQTSLTTGENIVIHYWQNLVTGVREGFKFK